MFAKGQVKRERQRARENEEQINVNDHDDLSPIDFGSTIIINFF